MRDFSFITPFLAIIVMVIFLQHHLVTSQSRIQQKIALLQFRQSFNITTPTACFYYSYYDASTVYSDESYPKTMNWSMGSDYCTWEGVTCQHETGDVIGLDLSCSQLEGAILPNSTLFQLSHLRFLNLSNNDFSLSNQFPQEFGFFAKGLTHLNLSSTGFSGRVPSGISHLYKMVSLDLSHNYCKTICLDWIYDAKLEDEVFDSLLQNLTQLRVLNLYGVNISSVLPMNLSASLRVLNLGETSLYGVLPQEVFHLPNLEILELSYNYDLTGVLPKVKWGSSATLQHLSLDSINFQQSGIPDSIGFMDALATLSLWDCNLSGPIPKSIRNLSQLTWLGLGGNNFNGPIPIILANLTGLDLSFNNFTGPLLPWLFNHSSLELLYLRGNRFTGPLYDFNSTKSQLKSFSCGNNLLSGVLDMKMFSRLESLKYLDLSHNSLSLRSSNTTTLPPKLTDLRLSSCNMKEFPHFPRDAEISLEWVDLSNNEIEGEIPQWIGSVYWYLNISHNRLTGGLEQLPWNNIQYLDLQSNKLNGSLPTLICNSSSLELLNLSNNTLSGVLPICRKYLTSLQVLDLRMNNIEGSLPATLSNFRNLQTINLNGNRLEGRIPSSFAEFDDLKVLDLGNNQINDIFPQCLEALPNLQVLVLKSNKFHGIISQSSEVEHTFPSLRIIDLSCNDFWGPLPSMYFQNFKAMMIGDVNERKATYIGPDLANADASYSDSTILLIKGVEIQLVRILTVLTTIDLSRNNFGGEIPEYIGKLLLLRDLNLSHNLVTGHIPSSIGNLSMLESLDLSSNQLEGEIPRQLTSIYSLERLNLSCNQLRGHIPEGSQFNTFENDSYVGNMELCGHPLSKKCETDIGTKEDDDEDDDYFFSGFTWEAVVIGYGCGVVPAFVAGYLMLLAGKPKWFAGIIARELGLKIRRMEIRSR